MLDRAQIQESRPHGDRTGHRVERDHIAPGGNGVFKLTFIVGDRVVGK